MDLARAQRRILQRMLATGAETLGGGEFFHAVLRLVYPDGNGGRLNPRGLPFSTDEFFLGKGNFSQRMDLITVAVGAEPNRSAVKHGLVPGFTGLAAVLNTSYHSPTVAALSDHAERYLVCTHVDLDEHVGIATMHLATNVIDFPTDEELGGWPVDSYFQLLYLLDGIQQELLEERPPDPAGPPPTAAAEYGLPLRLALPANAQAHQPSALL